MGQNSKWKNKQTWIEWQWTGLKKYSSHKSKLSMVRKGNKNYAKWVTRDMRYKQIMEMHRKIHRRSGKGPEWWAKKEKEKRNIMRWVGSEAKFLFKIEMSHKGYKMVVRKKEKDVWERHGMTCNHEWENKDKWKHHGISRNGKGISVKHWGEVKSPHNEGRVLGKKLKWDRMHRASTESLWWAATLNNR
jgi:hypothetical protein